MCCFFLGARHAVPGEHPWHTRAVLDVLRNENNFVRRGNSPGSRRHLRGDNAASRAELECQLLVVLHANFKLVDRRVNGPDRFFAMSAVIVRSSHQICSRRTQRLNRFANVVVPLRCSSCGRCGLRVRGWRSRRRDYRKRQRKTEGHDREHIHEPILH